MDDILEFTGSPETMVLEKAPISKGTFSDKEGKKSFIQEVNFNSTGDKTSIRYTDKVENFVYHEDQLLCIHVAREDKTPLYKIDFYYEEDLLVKKTKTNEQGIIEESETYHYNQEGNLSEKKSLTMTYEYIYNEENLLIEERWHSEFSLNQIIKYSYENNKRIGICYFSGDEIPGRKIIYKRESHGFISEEIVYSTSNIIISHFKYEYITIYKNNWLKRIKYTLHTNNRRKEATEAQYRDFKFYENTENPDINEDCNKVEDINSIQELTFDNGIYKGEVMNHEMHGSGEFIFETGTKYEGSFRNNKMEGRGKLTYISGKVYEGTFANNVLEGPGACRWENGDFYAGEFKNGKMHGKGCYIWNNGNRFEGMFENNKRTEQGILYKASELESTAPPEWVNELFK